MVGLSHKHVTNMFCALVSFPGPGLSHFTTWYLGQLELNQAMETTFFGEAFSGRQNWEKQLVNVTLGQL